MGEIYCMVDTNICAVFKPLQLSACPVPRHEFPTSYDMWWFSLCVCVCVCVCVCWGGFQWFEVWGDCSVCLYLCACGPSLFKLFPFYPHYQYNILIKWYFNISSDMCWGKKKWHCYKDSSLLTKRILSITVTGMLIFWLTAILCQLAEVMQ